MEQLILLEQEEYQELQDKMKAVLVDKIEITKSPEGSGYAFHPEETTQALLGVLGEMGVPIAVIGRDFVPETEE